MNCNQLGRRNVSLELAKVLRAKLYNSMKRSDGGHGDQKSGGQNDTPINAAEKVAKQTGVSEATVKRDAKLGDALTLPGPREPRVGRYPIGDLIQAACISRARLDRIARGEEMPAEQAQLQFSNQTNTMTPPTRITRRNRYEKLPPNSKLVTRPSRWGNPYEVGKTYPDEGRIEDNAAAVAAFRRYISRNPRLVETARSELAGFNLACACHPGDPCHADVWLEIVNQQPVSLWRNTPRSPHR